MRPKYFINSATEAVATNFDCYGKERSLVYERDNKVFLVDRTPDQIVQDSFNYYGTGLKGALEGSRKLLHKKKRVPVALSIQQGIVLFCCDLPDKQGKVWFNNSLILNATVKSSRETNVYLPSGQEITIAMRFHLFQDKREKAAYVLQNFRIRHDLDCTINKYLDNYAKIEKVSEKQETYSIK